jgi:hypothetical protein
MPRSVHRAYRVRCVRECCVCRARWSRACRVSANRSHVYSTLTVNLDEQSNVRRTDISQPRRHHPVPPPTRISPLAGSPTATPPSGHGDTGRASRARRRRSDDRAPPPLDPASDGGEAPARAQKPHRASGSTGGDDPRPCGAITRAQDCRSVPKPATSTCFRHAASRQACAADGTLEASLGPAHLRACRVRSRVIARRGRKPAMSLRDVSAQP